MRLGLELGLELGLKVGLGLGSGLGLVSLMKNEGENYVTQRDVIRELSS